MEQPIPTTLVLVTRLSLTREKLGSDLVVAGRPVLAGPVEATALGNVLVQAQAAERLSSLAEGRALIRHSFPLETFEPRTPARWEAAY